jgi:Domain of unknown function (DUF5619)
MAQCPVSLTREMLKDPVDLEVEGPALDFRRARELADRRAREFSSQPMLLAWFDQAAGRFSPNLVCCGDDKPTWLLYAESRGGDLVIDINREEYVFVYRRG